MSTNKYPVVTINDLEESEKGPVWVLNTSVAPRRANIVIPVPSSGGRMSQVVVPMTFIPINLTEQISRSNLLASTEFRNAILKGHIKLISTEEAKARLAEQGAAQEAERIRQFDISTGTNEAQPATSDFDKAEILMDAAGNNTPNEISPPVAALAATLSTTDEVSVINTLRSMGQLSKAEYRYVYDQARQFGFKKLRNFCREAAGVKSKKAA
jgi:hypothetical protein